MAPKIREVLASLAGASAPQKKMARKKTPVASSDDSTMAAAPAAAPEPAATPTINTRALAEKFGRQLLQGDQSPVVGDINAREKVQTDNQQ